MLQLLKMVTWRSEAKFIDAINSAFLNLHTCNMGQSTRIKWKDMLEKFFDGATKKKKSAEKTSYLRCLTKTRISWRRFAIFFWCLTDNFSHHLEERLCG